MVNKSTLSAEGFFAQAFGLAKLAAVSFGRLAKRGDE